MLGFLEFLGKRVLATVPLLVGISFVSFSIIYAVPGDYVDTWISRTAAFTGQTIEELEPQAEALRRKYGLDKPFLQQYGSWLWGIVSEGDFGPSFSQSREVADVMSQRLGRTLLLAIITLVIGQVTGALLGIYAALNQYKIGDVAATVLAFTGITIPKFVISLIILYFMAFVFHSPYIGAMLSPQYQIADEVTWGMVGNYFLHVWPVILISVWAGQAYTLRMMRGNLLDTMNRQYVETARAKGLSNGKVIFLHAVPNALHPIIMNQGARFDYMVKGEIEIAIVLGIPTIGPLILNAVYQRDSYLVAAIFLAVAVLLVIGNLIADLLLALLDPRVRHATMRQH